MNVNKNTRIELSSIEDCAAFKELIVLAKCTSEDIKAIGTDKNYINRHLKKLMS